MPVEDNVMLLLLVLNPRYLRLGGRPLIPWAGGMSLSQSLSRQRVLTWPGEIALFPLPKNLQRERRHSMSFAW